jgi:hypothetical protein
MSSLTSRINALIVATRNKILVGIGMDSPNGATYKELVDQYEGNRQFFEEEVYPKQVSGISSFAGPIIEACVKEAHPTRKKVWNNHSLTYNEARILEVDASSGPVTISLPQRTVDPMIVTIVKIDAGPHSVTIVGDSFLSGSTSLILTGASRVKTLCNGSTTWLEI